MTTRENIERLFKDNYSGLYALALALLRDEDMARDAVHDVFADLLISCRDDGIGKGYLVRCVRNRCINLLKEMSARERIGALIPSGWPQTEEDNEELHEEYLSRLRKMIADELPPQCSKIMRLRYEEGLSYQDIADSCGISKVAVYKHLRNGLDYIRKNMVKL